MSQGFEYLLLDSEGLSQLVRRTREMAEWLVAARRAGAELHASAVTLVEARDQRVRQTAFDYAVSLIVVDPATEDIARSASKLLGAIEQSGHKYGMDAIVVATALALPGRTVILTSDPEDIAMLLGDNKHLVGVVRLS